MIREALEKMFEYGEANGKISVFKSENGNEYTLKGQKVELIEEPRYSPSRIYVNSLDSLVKLVKTEIKHPGIELPIFVEVASHKTVNAYTTYNKYRFERQYLYQADADVKDFRFDWHDYESAMIAFRSQFSQDEGVEYVLNLLSRITDEDSVKQEDNGLSQTVEIKKGVSLKAVENIKPIVTLRPYRTFLEVMQPASEFLLRLQEGGRVGLFEADGGMWKLKAKDYIAQYLEDKFVDMEDVIVMR